MGWQLSLVILKDNYINNKWSTEATGRLAVTTHAERLPLAAEPAGTNETSLSGVAAFGPWDSASVEPGRGHGERRQLFSCEGQLRRPQQASANATVVCGWPMPATARTFHPGTFIVSEVDGAEAGDSAQECSSATDPDRTASQIRWGDWSGKSDENSCRISHVPESSCWNWLLLRAPEGDCIPSCENAASHPPRLP